MDDLMDFKTFLDEMDFKSFLGRQYPILSRMKVILSNDAVREVRHRLKKGQSVKAISIDMDITLDQVYKIRRGETYKEVE